MSLLAATVRISSALRPGPRKLARWVGAGPASDFDVVVAEHCIRHVVITFSTAPTDVFVRIINRCEQLSIRATFAGGHSASFRSSFNVLRGETSFVGPRPERPEGVDVFARIVHRYRERHRAKSGVTRWAQVNGLRGKTSVPDRAEWDNHYLENWSLCSTSRSRYRRSRPSQVPAMSSSLER